MQLEREFYKLPLCFDTERLAMEVNAFTELDWRVHPQGHTGNSALPLIALQGDITNDGVQGRMLPTEHLKRCPYIQQILSEFQTVWGRTRLMRISAHADATMHFDSNYYWLQRVRVHIPIITFPEVNFICGTKSVHMAAGEAWIFDTWKLHNVINPTSYERIHLVADTVGSSFFWNLVTKTEAEPRFIPYRAEQFTEVVTENINFPVVMSPWELEYLVNFILFDLEQAQAYKSQQFHNLLKILKSFQWEWRSLWARYGTSPVGKNDYEQALAQLECKLQPLENSLLLTNKGEAVSIIRRTIIMTALNYSLQDEILQIKATQQLKNTAIEVAQPLHHPTDIRTASSSNLKRNSSASASHSFPQSQFDRPIFIVAAPRSGSTLLFETLAHSSSVWTVGGESHELFEKIPALNPANRNFTSNALTAADATDAIATQLKVNILEKLRDRQGNSLSPDTSSFRLLEKTPKNALRIPFLNAIFPDALFIYLYRDPQENISSILEAWRSKRFITYPQLPNWQGSPWSLLLIPEWQQLKHKSLAEIATTQWTSANSHILDSLAQIPSQRWCAVSYKELVNSPQATAKRLSDFAGISWDFELEGALPLSRHTLTPPNSQKWEKNAKELEPVLPLTILIAQAAQKLIKQFSGDRHEVKHLSPVSDLPQSSNSTHHLAMPENIQPPSISDRQEGSKQSPLRSVYTTSLPEILSQLRLSLVVSTYQAGKLIVVRAEDKAVINTHFEIFQKPMGIAVAQSRLAVGGRHEIMELRNIPAVAQKLEPVGKYDACYLPRRTHVTGNIDIHEMVWAGDELWIVNTLFSCLCTIDNEHSFTPRWRPKFITALAPEDRCHLNGLSIVNGKPKFVTALGKTDSDRGWRTHKAKGGVLIDVETDEIICENLSMPHSPRWYQDRLWFLESGNGSLATVDINSGRVETVAQLPGFTRGLDFYGSLAFIGLSQVRETAVFSGIPITTQLQERNCGVWVVNIQTAQVVAFLKFEDAIQEVFAVQLLTGVRFPEISLDNEQLISSAYVLPNEALQSVPSTFVSLT